MAFPTPLLDARYAREREQNERDRRQILAATLRWLSEHAAQCGFQSGYIFGSLTHKNRFTKHSDVDLAVETHKVGDVCDLMRGLSMHLLRDVDVVPLDQIHFAQKIRERKKIGKKVCNGQRTNCKVISRDERSAMAYRQS